MAFATVPVPDYMMESGADHVAVIASSDFGRRRFCRNCGSPLAMQVDHQPDTIDLTIATLDHPERVAPGYHIFYSCRIPWGEPSDTLPRHDRFRPDTRGL